MEYKSQNVVCQNCKSNFIIELEDFKYYEKINVPAPTWCPECRMIRRLSCVNSWSLFWRNCDKCGKRTLSMHSPLKKIKVFCQPCWWADDWDGTEYALDYDPKKSFFLQLNELSEKIPYPALESSYLQNKNCEYSNSIGYSKNCFMTIWADFCENVFYSSILNGLKWSSDCIRGWKSELCYGSRSFIRGYKVLFCEECDDCVDVWFSRNCYGCTNCVGCVNLRGATNYIFNVKYSKEEYEKKIKEMKLDTWDGIKRLEIETSKFWLTKPYREYHGHSLNLNVTGEYVYTSKNSKECFILNGAENCKWCQFITVDGSKDCMDYTGWGNNAELIYESVLVGDKANNVKFSAYCLSDVLNVEYSYWCIAGKNNFGCFSLKRKNYCILNKQYEKVKYERIKKEIIEDMKKNPYIDKLGRVWSYGEFFQPGFGKYAYNKSNAMKFFPKTKENALAQSYSWDDVESPRVEHTIKSENLPKTITETEDSILQEIIECQDCKRSFKIVQGELELLRKLNLPLLHECPKCREDKRFSKENKPGMYHRNCAKCYVPIYTPYAPDRPEIIYCVKCYQGEFI